MNTIVVMAVRNGFTSCNWTMKGAVRNVSLNLKPKMSLLIQIEIILLFVILALDWCWPRKVK